MSIIRAIKLLFIALVVLLLLALVGVITGFIPSGDMRWELLIVVLSIATTAALLICGVWLIMTFLMNRLRVGQMLTYVEQAVRLNMPLPAVFRAIGEGEAGWMRRRIQYATVALEQGEPVAVALELLGGFPGRVVGLVAAAERVGRLPQVMHRLVEQRRARQRRNAGGIAVPFYRAYPLFLGFVIVNVSFMLMVFVFPKFESIFHDFKIQTPWITQTTFAVTETIGPWGALLVAFLLLGGMIQTLWARWAGGGFGLYEGAGAWILNRLPCIGSVRTYAALGESLQFCADAIDAGRPIEDSLSEAAPIAANPIVRKKLWRWSDELRRGQSLTQSARTARMPGIVIGMLSTAVQTADVAEVFRFLGRYYASRFSRAMALLQGAFVPIVVFVMGSIVAWLALSIFLPLMQLINIVSPVKYRP